MTGAEEAAGTPPAGSSETGAGNEAAASAFDDTRFAHASEAEMARILDFYAVRWEYEPTTFPILWNLDGDVVESFAPDFYLPDLEVFLEMTTLKQRLVRKKNRKLRRLRELYPHIRIKLFYARDFRAMMLKYGRLGLAESLSGTLGQVVPLRPDAPDAADTPDAPDAPAVANDDATGRSGIDAIDLADGLPAAAEEAPTTTTAPRAAPRPRSARRRRRAPGANQPGAEQREARA